jgi:hypothetical protein
MFPNPELPGGAEIIDPLSGTWEVAKDGNVVDTGSWWACAYCPYQEVCATTTPGRISTKDVLSSAAYANVEVLTQCETCAVVFGETPAECPGHD